MASGRCPSCSRDYTAGEVQGLGILRPRAEEKGGPFLEFRCPGCDRVMRLLPHGHGRYAPPGEPPPPEASAEEMRPPWVGRSAGPPGPDHATPEPETAAAQTSSRRQAEPARPARDRPPPPPPRPSSIEEAREALGVGPAATREEVARAFRERSLGCHPDKVAHLDAEIQALAEERFRRLREAYERLTS
jgi:hypothetical protein